MRCRVALLALAALGASCRLETAAPQAACATDPGQGPRGEVWVYTSMYRHVLDHFDPLLRRALPQVTVRWFQAGSEKVASRLEAEFASGGTQADVLLTSDPFLYERLKRERRLLRYVSPNGVRTAPSLVDPDGHFASARLSTMVLVHRQGTPAPESFAALADEPFRDQVALGDPLTSGTAFTWAVFYARAHGVDGFLALRKNGARVAGGNAAVLQKVEGGEAKVGVLLLENALAAKAKGSPVEVAWPRDGAVVVPGPVGILATTRNAEAAKAVVDVLLSSEGQRLIVEKGDMHGVDPRLGGPGGEAGVEALLAKSQPWSEAVLDDGLARGQAVKEAFARAFAK